MAYEQLTLEEMNYIEMCIKQGVRRIVYDRI